MAEKSRKYEFSWDVVDSSMDVARPHLGDTTTVGVYRLFQFALRDVLETRFGTEITDDIFRDAGILAGKAFFKRYCDGVTDLETLTKMLQEKFRALGIGIVRFEVTDVEHMTFQLTVDEDLDCSGLPDSSDQICIYDEGFIKGILDSFTGGDFTVREVDCWCSGARTCRFRAALDPKDF